MAGTPSKSNLSLATLLIALIAALGLSAPGVKSGDDKPAPANRPPSRVNSPEKIYEHSAEAMILDFLDADTDEFSAGKAWSWSSGMGDAAACPKAGPLCWGDSDRDPRRNYSLQFVIATIPQPDSPLLSYRFDAQVDAIQEAAVAAGYVPDSFDLPWIMSEKRTASDLRLAVPIRITAEPGSSTTSLKLETEGDDHTEQEPGLMLFHDRNQHRLLMVLLVGESPVRGVNRTALRGALDQVAWLSGWRSGDPRYQHHAPEALVCLAQAGRSAHDNSPRIRILGPTFSGSAESIRFTLENWFHSFPTAPPHAISATSCWSTTSHLTIDPTAETVRVDIVSGSATGVDTSFQHDARINYKTVRLPSEVMQQHIITELKQHLDAGDDHPRIAFLTEETSYGSATYDAAKGNEKADLLAQNVSTYSYPFLELPFPLHISDLRNSEGVVQSQPAQLAPNLGHRDLALGGESGPDETDVVPSFSPRSAVYESLILTQLFRTIHRERIRYVGIVATDIEDLIFLVREIRANCPDTEPFVINSDLRYLHSDINSALVGTLVFANYPLFSMSERFTWPFGAERRIQFPTEMAQGAYNAMLVLLHDRDNHDKLLDRLLDYGEPLQAARPKGDLPGLWEGVVGRNDIWPIRASVPEPVANNVFRRYTVPGQFKLDFATGIYPVSFQIAIFIFSIICLSAAVILLHPARFGTVPSLHRILGDAIIQDWALERRLLVSAVALGFLTAYTVAGGFALLPLELEHLLGTVADHRRFLGYATELVVIVVSSALLAATIRSLLRLGGCPRPKPQFPVMAGLLLITGVIQLLLSGFFVYSIWTSDRTTILFTFLRSANLGNGVSPLLPLIFAGVGGLTLLACQLERLRLLEDCSTRTSQTADVSFTGLAGQDSFYGVDQQEEKITRLLECRPLTLPGARILLALLIVGLVYDVAYFCWIDRDPWRAIDGRWFYFLFLAVSATVYGLFALLLLRFVLVWRAVKGLLRRLYWHPSRIGYDELRRRSIPSRSEEQRVGLFEPPPSRTAVEGALENARTLLHRANSIGNSGAAAPLTETLSERLKANVLELRATVRDAELGFSRLLEREAAGDIPSTVSRRLDLHTAMARLSRVIVTIFEPEWRARTNPLLVTTPFSKEEKEKDEEEELIAQANIFVANRVVDFLHNVFPQLANLVGFAMAAVLALMMAISVYPFPRHDSLLWFSWIVLLTVIGISITVFAQMNRDRIISMLSGTQPGRLNFDSGFIGSLLLYAVIPILALLGAQFPGALGGIFSWIGGLFRGQR